jgi:hypothetical protein
MRATLAAGIRAYRTIRRRCLTNDLLDVPLD